MSIVGDAFAKPMLAALDAHPGAGTSSSLWLIISSGVMWSAEVKAGLLRHIPRLTHGRQPGLVGGGGHGPAPSRGSAHARSTAGLRARRRRQGLIERRRRGSRAGIGRAGPAGAARSRARRLLQGSREDRDHLPIIDGERWIDPGRLRDGRGPTALSSCSAGARCASTRVARRSSPRRSRRR